VPSRIANGYSQLFSPSESGRRPAEMADAMGERINLRMTIAPMMQIAMDTADMMRRDSAVLM
jgi:hypothetical protein